MSAVADEHASNASSAEDSAETRKRPEHGESSRAGMCVDFVETVQSSRTPLEMLRRFLVRNV